MHQRIHTNKGQFAQQSVHDDLVAFFDHPFLVFCDSTRKPSIARKQYFLRIKITAGMTTNMNFIDVTILYLT